VKHNFGKEMTLNIITSANSLDSAKEPIPNQIIITAGSAYVDIDVLASSIALQELLQKQGVKASVCHTGPLNATVPTHLAIKVEHLIQKSPLSFQGDVCFILVDVSDPHHFEKFVNQAKVYKIFDHHFGYENYWQQRLGENAVIQPIGACATLIWQEHKKFPNIQVSPLACELLALAILSNTLNLQASVTTDLDRSALAELENKANLQPNWRKLYYDQTQTTLINNLNATISSDTKQIQFQGKPLQFCQLEVWNGQDIIKTSPIQETMAQIFKEGEWLISLLDLSSGRNWVFSNEPQVLQSLHSPLNLEIKGDWFCSNKLWLRKEILKLWQSQAC
jgi:inorganic pyrophosphatase/exopolyphosphatase